MSVAVMNGVCRRGGGKSFFAQAVGHEKSKLFLLSRGSVCLGMEGSQPMRLHRWMMTGTPCFRVSGRVKKMIAAIRSMLSDMRKGD